MIVMNVKFNNVLSFYDFEVNFSYASKLKTSLIDGEYLKNVPSFRYKKLNVFVGSNATGKTSLIKCIWTTLLFLTKKNKSFITSIFNTKYNNSFIEIDLVEDNSQKHLLHRFKIKSDNTVNDIEVKMSHTYVSLSTAQSSHDSYETKVRELNEMEDNYIDYLECLNNCGITIGWNTILPSTEEGFDKISYVKTRNDEEEQTYENILERVFKTLDPSIVNVSKSKDANNAYVFEHENTEKIIIQEGMTISAIPYLSSGTKYGINIANMMFGIKYHQNGIYLIDEQFSYVNSDIEAAMLSTMVSMLGDNEQIFFTTHNSSILSLGFPFHSFYFMKKSFNNDRNEISISCGSEVENRNNVSPKTILDNDIFATAPNLNGIFELGEDNNG